MDPAVRINNLLPKLVGDANRHKQIYAHGIAEKWRYVLYSLDKIRQLDASPPEYTAFGSLDYEAEIRYFCDNLWTSLHSTLDVLAQLANTTIANPLDEENTDFATMVNHLNQTQAGSQLQNRLDKLKRSRVYRNLRELRRCITHRRSVYIETQTTQASGTPGYQIATSSIPMVKRIICDDPLALTPSVSKGRELVPFSQDIVNKVSDHVDRILIVINSSF
jgi:hypothetical protein